MTTTHSTISSQNRHPDLCRQSRPTAKHAGIRNSKDMGVYNTPHQRLQIQIWGSGMVARGCTRSQYRALSGQWAVTRRDEKMSLLRASVTRDIRAYCQGRGLGKAACALLTFHVPADLRDYMPLFLQRTSPAHRFLDHTSNDVRFT